MKILHLISVHQWTGPANYLLQLCKFLQKNGENSLVGFRSYYKGALKKHFIENGINFTEDLKFSRGFKPILFYKDFKNLKKLIKEYSPDIIHCHNSKENILSGILRKSDNSFRLIRSIHNSKSVKRKFLSGYLLNLNDYLVTNCNDFKLKLIKNQKIEEDKIEVIRGFVNEQDFNVPNGNDFLFEQFNIAKETVKIGMVARFQPHRGHKYLIDAFCKLKRNGCDNIKLILVGRGENLEILKKYVKDMHCSGDIIFTGYIGEELPYLLNSLDIFVLLQEGSDGSCRAVLEAMASGLPIVTVYKGALKETVRDSCNGFFIKDKTNVADLFLKLKQLIENKSLREKMGKNSIKLIEKNFSMEKQLKKYYEFYRKILN